MSFFFLGSLIIKAKQYKKEGSLVMKCLLGGGPRIECANVIVLNKVDLLKEDEIVTLEAVLRKMNQTAEIVT